jgi:Dyp-type peroxidase family
MRTKGVEWSNVQALVMTAFPTLRCAAYVLWRFEETQHRRAASEWLWRLCQRVTTASHLDHIGAPPERGTQGPAYAESVAHVKALQEGKTAAPETWALNVAFTRSGLARLGTTEAELARFSDEFYEGMAPPPDADGRPGRRSSLLGDVDRNSPAHWTWGGWKACNDFDGVLLLYARTPASLKRLVAAELQAMHGVAAPVWSHFHADGTPVIPQGRLYKDSLGHFGFSDGISQPVIEDTPLADRMPKALRDVSVVAPGELLLGYKDTRDAVVSFKDPRDRNSRDLAKNGTYLVVRQLRQDVTEFRRFVGEAARAVFGRDDRKARDWIAGKLLGRRPAGDPLITPPAACRDPEARRNGFRFHAEDHDGLACPIGSHVRRANPRDTIGPDPETALRLSRMHRILRRGRPYGPLLRANGETGRDADRGLFFICLNASLAGQFELVQHSWINNPQFKELNGEVDPLSHVAADTFTVQSRPANIRLSGRKPFVQVVGGAYFFLPGLNAMRALSEAGLALEPGPAASDPEQG